MPSSLSSSDADTVPLWPSQSAHHGRRGGDTVGEDGDPSREEKRRLARGPKPGLYTLPQRESGEDRKNDDGGGGDGGSGGGSNGSRPSPYRNHPPGGLEYPAVPAPPRNHEDDQQEEEATPRTPPLMWILVILASLGGFLFGYDTGVISGALLLLTHRFDLSNEWQEGIVSATLAAAALISPFAGSVANYVGRKGTVLLGAACVIIGSVVMAAADGPGIVLLGRIIIGLGIGFASVTVPVYISECAPPHMRGGMVFLFQLNITVAMFVSVALDGALSYNKMDGWRYMLGIAAVPAALQLCTLPFMPESPRWLVSQGQSQLAGAVLGKLRGKVNIQKELREIQEANEKEMEFNKPYKNRGCSTLSNILGQSHTRRSLVIGCGLQMFQQLSGINIVMYFSATIIHMAGITNDSNAIWLAALTAGINCTFTIVGLYLVDRVGRRPLLMVSSTGVILSLLFLSGGFLIAANSSPQLTPYTASGDLSPRQNHCATFKWCNKCAADPSCGVCYEDEWLEGADVFCLPILQDSKEMSRFSPITSNCSARWSYDVCPSSSGWVVVLAMTIFLMSFAIGMGPLPWTISSEIFPLWARTMGTAMATTTNWTFNLIISLTFLSLVNSMTEAGVFFFYAVLSLIGLFFVHIFVPETKGKTLEEIELLLANKKPS